MTTSPLLQATWQRSTTRRFLSWLFSWRIGRRLLLIGAAVVTLVALFYGVENWRGKRAWDRHSQALEARGEPVTIAALVPPPVPDEHNLALAPILAPMFGFYRGPSETEWRDTNGMWRLRCIEHAQRMPGQQSDVIIGNLDQGTLTDLEACRAFYRGNTNYPQPATAGTAAQDVLVALGKFDPELQELKAAAAERPQCRFPVHYREEPPYSILLPHLAILKKISTVLCLRAIARLDAGQADAALADLQLELRLSSAISNEPLLIDHLVRIALLNQSLQVIYEGLSRHAWSDAQLAAIEGELVAVNLLAEHQLAMRGERAFSIGTLEYVRRQGWKSDPGVFFPTDNGAGPLGAAAICVMPSGWLYQNMAVISRFLQDYPLSAVDVAARRVKPDISESAEPAVEELGYGPYTIFARLLLPAVSRATMRSARMQVLVDLARVACAVERFRLAGEQLPDTLAALVPRFLRAVPHDIMDGQPLRYRTIPAGGFSAYSVGWNETDEGGQRGWHEGRNDRVDPQEGDWVWGPVE